MSSTPTERLHLRDLAGISTFRLSLMLGGVFVAGSIAWGMALDGFRPDRYDVTGAIVCLLGVSVIMYAPRS